MRITIDSEVLSAHGWTIEEYLLMIYMGIGHKEIDFRIEYDNLFRRGLVTKDANGYLINKEGIDAVMEMLAANDAGMEVIAGRVKLARSLKETFPKGIKTGKFRWTESERNIVERILMYERKFKVKRTDDEILEAARAYVESFKGNFTYMKTLKYFIIKENSSDLDTWIEKIKEQSRNLAADYGEIS